MDLKQVKRGPLHPERRKRVGRGTGSGRGKTSGRGQKGQKSRSGYSQQATFEGGQMPLIRKIPKRGFSNSRFARRWAVVNVARLNLFEEGARVDPQALRERGLVKGAADAVKILGHGTLNVGLSVLAHQFSRSAREKIVQAGGTAAEL